MRISSYIYTYFLTGKNQSFLFFHFKKLTILCLVGPFLLFDLTFAKLILAGKDDILLTLCAY